MKLKTYNSERAPRPVGLYPHARQVGNMLYLSGVGPRKLGANDVPGVERDDQGRVVAYDMELQCRNVFDNVRMILEDSGSSWDRLIDVTVFLTDMKNDFPVFNKLYAEYFKENQPCRTTMEVNALPTDIAIELKCMATID
ncbi:RidA family protein [Roseivirga sp. BDSF3-8]|uniref:RidA family protein n=1 Tax=Roseivirga sp. BDSF3-8 TaxID=3241598 RepID=UPI00353257A4